MKIVIAIILLIAAAAATIYFYKLPKLQQNSFEQWILDRESYNKSVAEIAERINDLSPTPPVGKWKLREADFVSASPYVYAIYDDSHNIFRILLETGKQMHYRVIATFEPSGRGSWKLTNGEDLARLPAPEGAADPPDIARRESLRAGGGQAKGMITYIYNPELKLWVERK